MVPQKGCEVLMEHPLLYGANGCEHGLLVCPWNFALPRGRQLWLLCRYCRTDLLAIAKWGLRIQRGHCHARFLHPEIASQSLTQPQQAHAPAISYAECMVGLVDGLKLPRQVWALIQREPAPRSTPGLPLSGGM